MLDTIAFGIAGCLLFVTVLLITIHVWPRKTPGIPFLLLLWFVVAIVTAITIFSFRAAESAVLIVTNLAVYLFVVEAFIFIYGVAKSSLSVRLMVTLLERGDDPESFERTIESYSADFFLDHRLHRLVEQRLLVLNGDRYRLTPKGQLWAKVAQSMKDVLAVGPGG